MFAVGLAVAVGQDGKCVGPKICWNDRLMQQGEKMRPQRRWDCTWQDITRHALLLNCVEALLEPGCLDQKISASTCLRRLMCLHSGPLCNLLL